jgi:hypothetical protein
LEVGLAARPYIIQERRLDESIELVGQIASVHCLPGSDKIPRIGRRRRWVGFVDIERLPPVIAACRSLASFEAARVQASQLPKRRGDYE